MTATPAEKPEAVYEMTAAKRGLIKSSGRLVEHEGRWNDLAEMPENFRPMVGSYAEIATEAGRRNTAQVSHGFMDYLYAPEMVSDQPSKLDKAAVDAAIKGIESRGAK